MKMLADRLPAGRYLHCPNGSHLAMYDDQETYFAGLSQFLHDLAGPNQSAASPAGANRQSR
jgi:proline iminopeptidase